jgi:hypothetical protein
MKKDTQQFVGILFMARDYAHKAHLNTDSYSEHKALEGFYNTIDDLADSFVEAWQGRNLDFIGDFSIPDMPKSQPITSMKSILTKIEAARSCVPENDTALNNIVDEIVALCLSTIYRLAFLK